MTPEGIKRNIDRVLSFYEVTPKECYYPKNNECIEFLHVVGRLLDFQGAPKSGLSLLYLGIEDFNELKDFLLTDKDFALSEWLGYGQVDAVGKQATYIRPDGFSFMSNEYYWSCVLKEK